LGVSSFGVINRGKEEVKAFLNEFFNSTPDISLEINAAFIAGDWGASEWVMSGTNLSDFMGFPASGKRYTFRGASITEYENGKIRRNTDYYDFTSILQQVGYLPAVESRKVIPVAL
jgi:steroid delta-isomerase-like uncharacterized protein